MHPVFGVLLLHHICDWNDAVKYVVPPDSWLLDVCMYVALKLVMLLRSNYHKNVSLLLTLLVLLHFLRYSIDCCIISYNVPDYAAVYLFITGVEWNYGSNVGI